MYLTKKDFSDLQCSVSEVCKACSSLGVYRNGLACLNCPMKETTRKAESVIVENNTYKYKVCLCDGRFCDGYIKVTAGSEEMAYILAMEKIGTKLYEALPELGIEYSVELIDEDSEVE